MSWVNLNDVYVNKTGDTIAGDLSVGGALTVNDGKGTNTTYNVANEITTLRDSVSQDNDWITLNQFIKYKKTGNIVTVIGVARGGFGFGGNDEYGIVGTLPSEYCPSIDIPFVFHAMGGTSSNKSGFINKTGEIKLYDRVNYVAYWGFCVSYPI